MQFHAGVVRAGQATAAQTAGRHVEVAPILLHHHIGGDLRCAEDGMLGLIDRKAFPDPMFVLRIVVLPTGRQFFKADRVWSIAIHFVGRHMNEG